MAEPERARGKGRALGKVRSGSFPDALPLSWLFATLFLLAAAPAPAQNRDLARGSLGVPREGQIALHYEVEYALPEVHRWYTPVHLADLYDRPWQTVDTRYARDSYTRYVNALLEGYEYYDLLGSPLGRGWLVYSWTQQQPGPKGD